MIIPSAVPASIIPVEQTATNADFDDDDGDDEGLDDDKPATGLLPPPIPDTVAVVAPVLIDAPGLPPPPKSPQPLPEAATAAPQGIPGLPPPP
jgi:hypothetical protein